jgi:hypothetical protein
MKKKEKYVVSIYEYRCRRCQEIFTETIEDSFAVLVSQMLNLNKTENEIEEEKRRFEEERKKDEELITEKPRLFEIHICNDDGRGLSDLIGCEPAREVTLSSKGNWRGQFRDHLKANFTGRKKESPYNGY